MPFLMPSKSQRPLAVNHLVPVSMASPVTSRSDLGKLVVPSLDWTWATVVGYSMPGPPIHKLTPNTISTAAIPAPHQ